MRRILDLLIASLAPAITWPVLIIIAIANRMEPGARSCTGGAALGCTGAPFDMLRFRMRRPTVGRMNG